MPYQAVFHICKQPEDEWSAGKPYSSDRIFSRNRWKTFLTIVLSTICYRKANMEFVFTMKDCLMQCGSWYRPLILLNIPHVLSAYCVCLKNCMKADISNYSLTRRIIKRIYSWCEGAVNKVYAYLYNHFKEKVNLEEIAKFVKQNPSALCRYFKQRTDKSIFQCLAEIRIEHACKLLTYSNMNISQVAYESGYNSVTHFIAQFEKITKRTPSEYRMQIKLWEYLNTMTSGIQTACTSKKNKPFRYARNTNLLPSKLRWIGLE